jgi:hypothetical protein
MYTTPPLSSDCPVVGLAVAVKQCYSFEKFLVAAQAVWNNLEEDGGFMISHYNKRREQVM